MKKQIKLITALFFLTIIGSQAQTSFGIKGGLNVPNVKVEGLGALSPTSNFITSFSYGLTAEMQIDEHFYFSPEVLHTRHGFSLEESRDFEVFDVEVPVGAKVITKSDYIQVPLLMKYKFGKRGNVRGYLMAGPSFAYAAHATSQLKATVLLFEVNLGKRDLDLTKDIYNRFEVGGTFGAGVEIPFHKVNILFEARYNQGYTDLLDDPIIDIKLKNYSFGFMGGIAMPI